jgi:hypothetical protein
MPDSSAIQSRGLLRHDEAPPRRHPKDRAGPALMA